MQRLKKLWEEHKKALLISLMAAVLFGMAAHAFLFFNPSFSHDALWVNQYADDEWKISIGRFMQPFWRILRGSVIATWLIGIIAMLANAVSSFLLCQIFGLRSRSALVAVNGILVCNLSVIYTFFSFSHEGDMFAVSCLLAVLGMYLADKKRIGWFLCAACLTMSMGFYQAYLGVAVGVAVLVALLNLLQMTDYKAILKKQVRYFSAIALGCGLYFVATKVMQTLAGVDAANSYNSLSQIAAVGIQGLINGAVGAYRQFAKIVFVNPALYGESPFRTYLKALFFIVSVIAFFTAAVWLLVDWFLKRKIPLVRILLCTVLLCVYPLAANCVIVVSGLSQVHMALASCLIYIPVFWLTEQKATDKPVAAPIRQWVYLVTQASLCLILLCNIVFANGIYTIKYLQERQTLSTMTRIVDRMEQTEGFVPAQTPVVFVGLLSDNKTLAGNDFMLNEYYNLGIPQYTVTYEVTLYKFMQYYLHYPMLVPKEKESAAVRESEEVKAMGVFPAKDSVQMIDGIMTVKLAEA